MLILIRDKNVGVIKKEVGTLGREIDALLTDRKEPFSPESKFESV